jgi:hypothetical protein
MAIRAINRDDNSCDYSLFPVGMFDFTSEVQNAALYAIKKQSNYHDAARIIMATNAALNSLHKLETIMSQYKD